MVTINEVVGKWVERGQPYTTAVTPVERSILLEAKEVRVVPSSNYLYKAKEGVLELFYAAFDHPLCGIRVENPGYTSGSSFTVYYYTIGSLPVDKFIYTIIPPNSPPGVYGIRRITAWYWQEWLRLSLINIDSVPHTCLGYGYQVSFTKEEKS